MPADAPADEVGDEPLLLARRTGLPVFAGRDRAAALAALIERHPELDVVLSDDGLQHASLRRDLELAVFDDRGVGNARVLPAGPLREPLDALDACDAIVLADPGNAIRPRAAPAPPSHAHVFHRRVRAQDVVHLASGRTTTLAEFAALAAHREVTAFAAIAQPQRLFDTLRQIGVAARGIALADHAPISAAWLAGLAGELVVMTEKDAVKCMGFADQRCWYLRVAAELDRGLIDFVEDRLRGS